MASKEDIIAEAEALTTLDGNPGWAILEKWLKEAIETTKDQLASKKINKNWNETLRLQAKYESFTTLLYLKDRRIQAGVKAKKEQSG